MIGPTKVVKQSTGGPRKKEERIFKVAIFCSIFVMTISLNFAICELLKVLKLYSYIKLNVLTVLFCEKT